MSNTDLLQLKNRLDALAVFRSILSDDVMQALCQHLDCPTLENYALFVAKLYEAQNGDLGKHIKGLCENCENVYVRTIGEGLIAPEYVENAVQEELKTLQRVIELTPKILCEPLDFAEYLPKFKSNDVDIANSYSHRVQNINRYGYGIYAKNKMFYIDDANNIAPVKYPDTVSLDSLIGYASQRKTIMDNTKALLEGKPAANILLTGDAGTGKSSTVKAVANELSDCGLRIIEIRKDQLSVIPRILDELTANPLKFILFIDDLSFLKDDDNFNALKAVLEGSVSARSKNVVIYATSNRRHIIKENFSDREGDDVHRNDTMQEQISLSERFGIHITYGKPDKKTYLHIVKRIAENSGIDLPDAELELKAERFALERGGRSGRIAKQFVDGLLSS